MIIWIYEYDYDDSVEYDYDDSVEYVYFWTLVGIEYMHHGPMSRCLVLVRLIVHKLK